MILKPHKLVFIIKVLNLLIGFPNNKYPPNKKNYLRCLLFGGAFSIRVKGLLVNGKDYPIYYGKQKMFETTNQLTLPKKLRLRVTMGHLIRSGRGAKAFFALCGMFSLGVFGSCTRWGEKKAGAVQIGEQLGLIRGI